MPIPMGIFATAGAAGIVVVDKYLVMSTNNGAGQYAYPWSVSGYGTKFADPSNNPTNTDNDFNDAGTLIAFGTRDIVQNVYSFSSSGYGTRYASPTAGDYSNRSYVRFNSAGSVLFYSWNNQDTNEYALEAWAFSNGFGSRFANSPTNRAFQKIDVNKISSDVVYDNFRARAFNNGWGSEYSQAVGIVGQSVSTFKFSDNGTLVVGPLNDGSNAGINAYPWTTGSGFGTRYNSPATFSSANSNRTTVNSNASVVAMVFGQSPFVAAYPFSSGFGSKYSDPSSALPNSTPVYLAFSKTGSAISIVSQINPFITTYAFSNGFGTKYSNPASLPNNSQEAVVTFA